MKNYKLFYIILTASILVAVGFALVLSYKEGDMDADEFSLVLGVGFAGMGTLNIALGLLFLAFILSKTWRIAFLYAGGIVLTLGAIAFWMGSIL